MESHRGFSFSSRDSEAIDIDRVQDSCSGAMWFLVGRSFWLHYRQTMLVWIQRKTLNSFVEVRVDFSLFSSLFLFLGRPWHPHKIFRLNLYCQVDKNSCFFLFLRLLSVWQCFFNFCTLFGLKDVNMKPIKQQQHDLYLESTSMARLPKPIPKFQTLNVECGMCLKVHWNNETPNQSLNCGTWGKRRRLWVQVPPLLAIFLAECFAISTEWCVLS